MSDEIIITITIRGGSVTVGGAASGAGQAAEVSGPTPQPLDQLRALGAVVQPPAPQLLAQLPPSSAPGQGPAPQPLDQLRALGAAGPLPTPAEQLPQATKPSRAKRGPDKGA
ncbi:MAG: hypothetical protein IPO81_12270 [Kouleothrix sp.]|nr:hypothetical protein [Kouleothrix sp.]